MSFPGAVRRAASASPPDAPAADRSFPRAVRLLARRDFLRVYDRGGTELTAAVTAEAAAVSVVGGRALQITGSRVFYRAPNPFVAAASVTVPSAALVSPDGKHVYVQDALAARRRAEEASDELRSEVIERKRAEEALFAKAARTLTLPTKSGRSVGGVWTPGKMC